MTQVVSHSEGKKTAPSEESKRELIARLRVVRHQRLPLGLGQPHVVGLCLRSAEAARVHHVPDLFRRVPVLID